MIFRVTFHPKTNAVELIAMEDVIKTIFERNNCQVQTEIVRRIKYYFTLEKGSKEDFTNAVKKILCLKEFYAAYQYVGFSDEEDDAISINSLSYEMNTDDTTATEILLSHNIKHGYLEEMINRDNMEMDLKRIMYILSFKPGTPQEKYSSISTMFVEFFYQVTDSKYAFQADGVSVDKTGGYAIKLYYDPKSYTEARELTGYCVNYEEKAFEKIPEFKKYVDILYFADMEECSLKAVYDSKEK